MSCTYIDTANYIYIYIFSMIINFIEVYIWSHKDKLYSCTNKYRLNIPKKKGQNSN